jgi:hypothetical protein
MLQSDDYKSTVKKITKSYADGISTFILRQSFSKTSFVFHFFGAMVSALLWTRWSVAQSITPI